MARSTECGRSSTRDVRKVFDAKPDIVDVDDSLESGRKRLVVSIDRQKAALLGVNQSEAVQALTAGLGGIDATYVRAGRETSPIPVRLELGVPDKARPRGRACAAGAVAERRAGPALGDRGRRGAALGRRDLPQGPAADGLGDRRRGGQARQPAVRHVRGRGHAAQGSAEGPRPRAALLQPAGGPVPAHAQVGRRVADHVRDVPRHGARVFRGPDPDLPAGRRAVRLVRRAARDHGADPAHHHRRDAGARAARRAVHRHVDDRHDRARRHHRAQLDPAGRLHQRRARARASRSPTP